MWILIAVILTATNGPVTSFNQEFTSKAKCEEAQRAILVLHPNIKSVCVAR